MKTKNDLRKEINSDLQKLTMSDREKWSRDIASHLFHSPFWKEAKTLFIYKSFKREVFTDIIINRAIMEGKEVCLPVVREKEMTFHPINNIPEEEYRLNTSYGIKEPPHSVPHRRPDGSSIMITPGLGFSLEGHRLGRGGGYYDRYLKDHNLITCGICFHVQVKEKITVDEHDRKVHYICTEKGLYKA